MKMFTNNTMFPDASSDDPHQVVAVLLRAGVVCVHCLKPEDSWDLDNLLTRRELWEEFDRRWLFCQRCGKALL